MYLRNGRIGVLDLSSGKASEQGYSEDRGLDDSSSIAVAEALATEHGQDSIVFGTGVLTGSFVPAACAGIVRAGGSGGSKIMPLMGFAGFELKLTGFDFIVLKGKAPGQGYVWARDGQLEFVAAPDMRALSSWGRTDKVRSEQGDAKIQVASCGPWGDACLKASQLVVNYWGGEDKVGTASALGAKNVLAVAFRGMGELELSEPDKHFEDSILLMREHLTTLGMSSGLASFYPNLARDDFSGLVHRLVGCYGCPYPCRTYLKTEEEPRELRLVAKEPGYLHYDAAALSKAFDMGIDARTACKILSACAKAGAEPVTVLSHCASLGKRIDLELVSAVLSKPSDIAPSGARNFEDSFPDQATYDACLGLGLCPRYWAKAGFDFEAVSEYAKSALGRPLK